MDEVNPHCPTCGREHADPGGGSLCTDHFHGLYDWKLDTYPDMGSYQDYDYEPMPVARPSEEELAFERDLDIVSMEPDPPPWFSPNGGRSAWLLAQGELHGHGHDPLTGKCEPGTPP